MDWIDPNHQTTSPKKIRSWETFQNFPLFIATENGYIHLQWSLLSLWKWICPCARLTAKLMSSSMVLDSRWLKSSKHQILITIDLPPSMINFIQTWLKYTAHINIRIWTNKIWAGGIKGGLWSMSFAWIIEQIIMHVTLYHLTLRFLEDLWPHHYHQCSFVPSFNETDTVIEKWKESKHFCNSPMYE